MMGLLNLCVGIVLKIKYSFQSTALGTVQSTALGTIQLFVWIYKSEQLSDFGGWVDFRKLDVRPKSEHCSDL